MIIEISSTSTSHLSPAPFFWNFLNTTSGFYLSRFIVAAKPIMISGISTAGMFGPSASTYA